MERTEWEGAANFSWSAENDNLTLRMHSRSFDWLYEIRGNEQDADTLRLGQVLRDGEVYWDEAERISGESGGLYGAWSFGENPWMGYGKYAIFVYTFFEDGTAGLNGVTFFPDDERPPVETAANHLWRADGGQLTMTPFGEQVLEYQIDGDTLTIGYIELTRVENN
jgi:hypothetical protein